LVENDNRYGNWVTSVYMEIAVKTDCVLRVAIAKLLLYYKYVQIIIICKCKL